MPYLYLVVGIIMAATSSVLSSVFSRAKGESRNAEILFNLVLAVTAAVCYSVVFLFDRSFTLSVIPYSLVFGLSSFCCFLFLQKAVESGPVSITSLFLSMSLVLSTIWGFFFWKDSSVTVLAIVGIILVAVSSALCILKKEKGKKMNWKWFVYVLIATAGNAVCAIVVKQEQQAFDGKYGTAMMMIGMIVASLAAGVFALVMRRKISVPRFGKVCYWPILAGIGNFLANGSVILLASTSLSPNLIYPAVSVGSVILPLIYSLFLKEKITWIQWIGIAVGIAAVILLSL